MLDALIVGAGPVGLFLALAALRFGRSVAVLEARPGFGDFEDDRALALSWGSWLLLERVGVAGRLAALATPIRHIHVSQTGAFGRTGLDARDAGVPALGFVVRYGELQRTLLEALPNDVVHLGAPVERVEHTHAGVSVLAAGHLQAARAAVIAEGGGALLDRLGFDVRVKDYGTFAVVASLAVDRPHGNVAYERFAPSGPIALLPHRERFAAVWTLPPDAAEAMRTASEPVFLRHLQDAFGWRAGRFVAVRGRSAFPLTLRRTTPAALGPIVTIGNAAQTLHPVAGQGLNLGLRDAWDCAQRLAHAADTFDGAAVASSRRSDRAATIAFTDGLSELFTTDLPPVPAARGTGLLTLDLLPGLRRGFARRLTLGLGR
jgi:2-octaprenyl-6-methoxyphenol hydroxylase